MRLPAGASEGISITSPAGTTTASRVAAKTARVGFEIRNFSAIANLSSKSNGYGTSLQVFRKHQNLSTVPKHFHEAFSIENFAVQVNDGTQRNNDRCVVTIDGNQGHRGFGKTI